MNDIKAYFLPQLVHSSGYGNGIHIRHLVAPMVSLAGDHTEIDLVPGTVDGAVGV